MFRYKKNIYLKNTQWPKELNTLLKNLINKSAFFLKNFCKLSN